MKIIRQELGEDNPYLTQMNIRRKQKELESRQRGVKEKLLKEIGPFPALMPAGSQEANVLADLHRNSLKLAMEEDF